MNRKVLGLGAVVLLAAAAGVVSFRSGPPAAPAPRKEVRVPATSAATTAVRAPLASKAETPMSPAAAKAMAHSRVFIEKAADGQAVRGEGYEAKVDASGLALKSPDFSLRMRPVTVEGGAKVVPLDKGVPQRAGANIAQVVRPEVVEEYVFENNRVEQLFRIAQAPAEGELRVKVAVEGDLSMEKVRGDENGWRDPQMKDGGLVFRNPDGRAVMSYHGAVAIDAAGRRQTLYPDVEGRNIVLAVPDTFMATAAFPVVIDPWLELNQSAQGGGITLSAKVSEGLSMVLDNSGNPHIVWSDNSSGNFEIYMRYFNGFEWSDLGGSTLSGGISKNPGKSSHPSISLNPDGNPAIAWDDDTSGDFEIYVREWDGTTWSELIGSATQGGISASAGLSLYPSIVHIAMLTEFPIGGSTPVVRFSPLVAWQQDVFGVSDIVTRMYFPGDEDSDEGWYALGSGNVSQTSAGVSERPRMIVDRFGRPFVAWHDTESGNFEIYLKGFFSDSTVGAPVLVGTTVGAQITFTVRGGQLPPGSETVGTALETGFVVNPGTGGVFGVLDGIDWIEVAGSATGGGISNTAGPSFHPSLSMNRERCELYVAWQEGPVTAPPPAPPTLNTNIFVRRLLTGAPAGTILDVGDYAGAWTEMAASGSGTGISGTGRGQYPSIAVTSGPAGFPVVAWEDDTATVGVGTIDQPEILVRQFFGGIWQDVGDAGSTFAQGGISATSNLSVRPIVMSAGQGQFVCAWQDGALGAFDVFVKKFFVVDLLQLSLDQQDLASVPIGIGGVTADTTIRLRANVRGEALASPAVSGVLAQFEVRPIGTPFIGTPTVSTSLGTPTNAVGLGNVVEALFNGAPNVQYAWRARAVDQIGRVGAWQSFGDNADTQTDFEVRLTIPTPNPSGLDQRRSDALTQVPLGSTTTESTVVFVGSIVPPDAVTQVQFEVEVVPVASAFTGTATSQGALVSGATTVVLTHPALSDGSYKWRARAVPAAGSPSPASAWVDFGGNLGTQADFVIQSPTPGALAQFFLDGTTPLPGGSTSPEAGVVLTGLVNSPVSGTQVQLEVEIRPIGVGFSGVPTHIGTLVSSGATSIVTAALPFDTYHWRARTTTAANTSSSWVSFGTNADGQIDFRLFIAPTPADVEDKDKCGLVGAEAVLLVAAAAALRRRRRTRIA